MLASGVITTLDGIMAIPAGRRLDTESILVRPSPTGIRISYCETFPILTSEVERRSSAIEPGVMILIKSLSNAVYDLSHSVGVPG